MSGRELGLTAFLGRHWSTIAILGGLGVAALLPFQSDHADIPWLQVVLGLSAIVLLFRNHWPLATVIAVLAIVGVATCLDVGTPGAVLPVAIAVFGYANRRDRIRAIVVAAITAVALVAFTWVGSGAPLLDPRVILLPVTILAAAAAGDATRSRRAILASMTERAIRAEQALAAEASRQVAEERLRIARDLHDVVAHQMTVINLHAGVASNAVGNDDDKASKSIATIAGAARSVLSEIGSLLAVLRTEGEPDRPPDAAGSLSRIDDLVREFDTLGLAVDRRTAGEAVALPAAVDVVAFRVVQEALTNVQRHGAARRANLALTFEPGWMTIVIENPVKKTGAVSHVTGHGLTGMRERVEAIHGSLAVGISRVGFRIEAKLPLAESRSRG